MFLFTGDAILCLQDSKGAVETLKALWLRALAALAENLGCIPSTHMAAVKYLYNENLATE